MESQSLDCGCFYEVDEERDLGKLHPCSELHRDLAARMRKPGSRWTILPVHDHRCSDECAASDDHMRAMERDADRQIAEAEE